MLLSKFEFIQDEVAGLSELRRARRDTSWRNCLADFWERTKYATGLIFKEKEIFVFALLQWSAIALGYYLWVQLLSWIPQSVWESEEDVRGLTLNLVFLAWSAVCVGLVAYPLGVFTGCIGAAHFLREQGHESTIAGCLKLTLPRSWSLWIFHWIDGWITVRQIVRRLPKDNDDRDNSAFHEAFYYAWKVGTIGMLPALLVLPAACSGKVLVAAGMESIHVVKRRTMDVVLLRGGYSLACWVVGIGAYAGTIAFFCVLDPPVASESEIFHFYAWAGLPILAAVAIVQLFVRPVFVIGTCHLYSEYAKAADLHLATPAPPSRGVNAFVAFLVLVVIVAAVMLYREEIGLMNILRVDAP